MRESYDYIVIGAGSAGCAVAARLSEHTDACVAVIEAGPPTAGRRLFEVPGLFARQLKSSYDWDFQSEPEAALNGRRAYLPRGRAIGGTSSMNTMLYVRGNPADYDGWRDNGALGWGYEDVLVDFRRSEDNTRGEDRFHAVGGPLTVSDARSVDSLLDAWVVAAEQAGHLGTRDFNGPQQEGVGIYQVTQRDGLRCSSAKAFLEPAAERANLTILDSTNALRLLWRGTRVIGVEVEHLGLVRELSVAAEVIVSAGAYLSPQLLMHSGVGNADELAALGIDPLLDLPAVGQNLQDHAGCLLAYPSRDQKRTGGDETAWVEAGGFLRSRPDLPAPDLQFHAAVGLSYDEGLGMPSQAGISFGPYVARPASRGWVRLRSSEPQSKPRIQHNFLADESDMLALRDGIRLGLEIAEQTALSQLVTAPSRGANRMLPNGDSDAVIDEFIRDTAFAFYHPCGTCAIGTVTDPELRVHGVEGVRVADTSVMPHLITGNTNAPAIMIGERAAALIKAGAPSR
jgi:choline dehydrogenase-like flavoprotein